MQPCSYRSPAYAMASMEIVGSNHHGEAHREPELRWCPASWFSSWIINDCLLPFPSIDFRIPLTLQTTMLISPPLSLTYPHYIETKPQRQSQRLVPTCPCARKEKKYLVWHISSLPSMTPLSTLLTYRDEKLWCASLEAWKSRQIATNPPHMRPCLPPKMLRPGARNWVSRLFTLRFEGLVETRPSRLDLEHSLLFGHWLEMEWRLDVLKMLHPFLRTALAASLDVVVVVFRFPMIGLDDVITIWIYCRFLHFNETVVTILLAYQCTGSRIVGYCRWMVVPKGNKGFVCPFCISARKKTSPACINQPDKTRS